MALLYRGRTYPISLLGRWQSCCALHQSFHMLSIKLCMVLSTSYAMHMHDGSCTACAAAAPTLYWLLLGS
jgi:hypothetical protein